VLPPPLPLGDSTAIINLLVLFIMT